MEQEEFKADPQQLRAEAEKEPRHRGLDDFRETIRILKQDKGFSYREIAAWFQQRGVNIDHNAVWRTCSKIGISAPSGGSNEQNEQYERQAGCESAMPWLEES